MKYLLSLFAFLTLNQSISAETIMKMGDLSLSQDLFNAQTKKAFAEGHVKIAEGELVAQQALYRQLENIYKAQPTAISLLEYKRGETAVKVAFSNVQEAKALVQATIADVGLYEKYLKQASGEKLTANDFSKQYLALWTARNSAALALVSKNEAELEQAKFELNMTKSLIVKNAVSQKELILRERDVVVAEESLQRAKGILQVSEDAMKKFSN